MEVTYVLFALNEQGIYAFVKVCTFCRFAVIQRVYSFKCRRQVKKNVFFQAHYDMHLYRFVLPYSDQAI